MTEQATATDKSFTAIKTIAYGMFVLGLGLSVYHTVIFFHEVLGAALISAIAAPIFIDGVQIIGKLARGRQFARKTRRLGLHVQLFGAVLSLAANVVGGHSWGDKILGVVFVGGYIGMEIFAELMRPATDDAAEASAQAAAQLKAQRSAAAQKAAATKKSNAAKAATKATAAKARSARQASTRKAKDDAAQITSLAQDTRAYL